MFLHHRKMSGEALEIWNKIRTKLNVPEEKLPLIVDQPVPKARLYIVLGSATLKKFFPGRKASPGDTISLEGGARALISWTPEYFALYGSKSETMQQHKVKMWHGIAAAVRNAYPIRK